MIYVHLAEGFEEIEAVAIIDVLRRGGLEVQSVSMAGDKLVRGAHGIAVEADILYEQANYETCEMIVLPGGMPGTTNLCAHKKLGAHIVSFAEKGKYVAAICAAPMILAKLGVLSGKQATIFTGMEENLTGAKVSSDRVVTDGKVITSKGPGTAMEFGVALVRLLKDEDTATKLEKSMIMG